MRKVIMLLFLGIVIMISCKSKVIERNVAAVENKEVNYIPYFIEIQKAKILYDNKKFQVCYNKLDSLFTLFEPKESLFIYESSMYCLLSDTLKKYDKVKINKLVNILVKNYGKEIYNFDRYGEQWKRIIANSGLSEEELKIMNKEFQRNINLGIRDTIGILAARDKAIRDKYIEGSKLDSIDNLNEPILLKIIKKYGYPKEILVGSKDFKNPAGDIKISILLKHLSPKVKKEIQPLLLEELKKGNCHPQIYAGMLDHMTIIQKDYTYPYYGTYKNVSIKDIVEINKNRLSIGLLKLNN